MRLVALMLTTAWGADSNDLWLDLDAIETRLGGDAGELHSDPLQTLVVAKVLDGHALTTEQETVWTSLRADLPWARLHFPPGRAAIGDVHRQDRASLDALIAAHRDEPGLFVVRARASADLPSRSNAALAVQRKRAAVDAVVAAGVAPTRVCASDLSDRVTLDPLNPSDAWLPGYLDLDRLAPVAGNADARARVAMNQSATVTWVPGRYLVQGHCSVPGGASALDRAAAEVDRFSVEITRHDFQIAADEVYGLFRGAAQREDVVGLAAQQCLRDHPLDGVWHFFDGREAPGQVVSWRDGRPLSSRLESVRGGDFDARLLWRPASAIPTARALLDPQWWQAGRAKSYKRWVVGRFVDEHARTRLDDLDTDVFAGLALAALTDPDQLLQPDPKAAGLRPARGYPLVVGDVERLEEVCEVRLDKGLTPAEVRGVQLLPDGQLVRRRYDVRDGEPRPGRLEAVGGRVSCEPVGLGRGQLLFLAPQDGVLVPRPLTLREIEAWRLTLDHAGLEMLTSEVGDPDANDLVQLFKVTPAYSSVARCMDALLPRDSRWDLRL